MKREDRLTQRDWVYKTPNPMSHLTKRAGMLKSTLLVYYNSGKLHRDVHCRPQHCWHAHLQRDRYIRSPKIPTKGYMIKKPRRAVSMRRHTSQAILDLPLLQSRSIEDM